MTNNMFTLFKPGYTAYYKPTKEEIWKVEEIEWVGNFFNQLPTTISKAFVIYTYNETEYTVLAEDLEKTIVQVEIGSPAYRVLFGL